MLKLMAAIVLAGGGSRRMGRDKRRLELAGRSLVQLMVDRLAPLFGRVLIIGARRGQAAAGGADQVGDLLPGAGPLGGIYTGLTLSPDPVNFVAPCDLPFLQEDLVRLLWRWADSHQVVVPQGPDGLEPLCAFYHRTCLPAIERALARGERRVRSFYPHVDVKSVPEAALRRVDPTLVSFFNVNSWQDYMEARRLADASAALHSRG